MDFAARSARLSVLLLLVAIGGYGAEAAPGDLLETDKTNVNVRSEPSTDSDVVTRINPGDIIIEVETQGEWYHVKLPRQEREGWIYGPLLTVFTDLEPEEPASAAPVASRPETGVKATASSFDRLLARLTAYDESLSGNAESGEAVFYKCGSCHTTVAGVHARGPSLAGVFGRRPAVAQGYDYSAGMRAFGREGAVWDEATLDRFIQRPDRIVKDTSMPFSGVRDAQDRRNLIAYLKQL